MAYQPYQGNTPRVQPSQVWAVLNMMQAANTKPTPLTASQQGALAAGQGPVSTSAADRFTLENLSTYNPSPKVGEVWNPGNQYLNALANANSPANKPQSGMSY